MAAMAAVWGGTAVALAVSPIGAVSAHPARAQAAKSVHVVQVVDRSPFGQMLATAKKGASLYVDPTGPCTGSCLVIWPPLLMPKGKTTPLGVTGLATTKFGAHRLQVTYKGQALYTFSSDSGTSVTGEGVGGFVVATVS